MNTINKPHPHLPSLQNTLAPLARVPKTLIQRQQNPVTYHIYDSTDKKQSLDHLLNGTDQHIWQQSASNEFRRLAQGNTVGIKGTNTIKFISKSQLPHDAKLHMQALSATSAHSNKKLTKYKWL